MTDMERLCKVLCWHEVCGECPSPDACIQTPHDFQQRNDTIRAVLKELREPTKEMIVRGQGAGYDAPMEDIYKAMIDTILQEAEGERDSSPRCASIFLNPTDGN